MNISLIYACWPNRPFGVTWCDLPFALRDCGLAARLQADGHRITEHFHVGQGAASNDTRTAFEIAGRISKTVRQARDEGAIAIILCGSCAVAALGAIGGLGTGARIVWMDAHPDMNTPDTSGSGLIEGMALAAASGMCWKAMAHRYCGIEPAASGQAILFGARDIDDGEQANLDAQSVATANGLSAIKDHLSGAGCIYAHLDMDVHDGLTVRTNAFAVPGGPDIKAVRDVLQGLPAGSVLSVTGLDPASADADKSLGIAVDHVSAFATAQDRQS